MHTVTEEAPYEDLGQLEARTSPPRDDVGAIARLHFSISGRCLMEYIIGSHSSRRHTRRSCTRIAALRTCHTPHFNALS